MLTKTREIILAEMKKEPYITEMELVEKAGIGKTAVYKNIDWLKEKGYIRREGSRNGGYWVVLESEAGVEKESVLAQGDSMAALMPLMNMAFEPGHIQEALNDFSEPEIRVIAAAEYYYYTGCAEECSALAQSYLDAENLALKLTANWIYAYSNFTLGRTELSLKVLGDIAETVRVKLTGSRAERLMTAFVATGATVLLHLPDDNLPDTTPFVKDLPEGLKLLAIYVLAHKFYLKGEYQRSMGMAESALMSTAKVYPIPMIYLHLVLAMDMVSLRMTEQAKEHFNLAWELAKPDGLIEPFAEHHGLLQGIVEMQLKKSEPESLHKILKLVYRFSSGWRNIHNPYAENQVADGLTATEFVISMMACRGWRNKEIAGELDIAESTVKANLRTVFEKLGITKRSELKRFMLK